MSEASNNSEDELLDRFVQQYEQADDPAALLHSSCASHPHLAGEFAVLAETHQLLSRVGAEPEPSLPDRLGDFRIVRRIACGGMGEIYEAVQEPFGRRVAVKTIHPQMVSPSARERFLREQQVLAGLHQTHIVPIFAAGCVGPTHYFAMPYLSGVSLREVLLDPSPSLPTGEPWGSPAYFRAVAGLLADAAEAIAHAQEHGIIHRDLKPANLMLDREGHVWVLDFGLAGFLAGEADAEPAASPPVGPADRGHLTSPGSTLGTLDYAAPEQLQGRAEARTDVWGLGVVLYQLLTLHRAHADPQPAAEADPKTRRLRELARPLTLPRRWAPQLPRDLEAICLKCLAAEPERRYPTAQALAEDLRCFLRGEQPRARPWGLAERLGRWCRRHPTRVGLLVLMTLLLAAAGLAGYTWQLRAGNSRNAVKLARSVAAQLDLVKQAVSITARQDKLRRLLAGFADDPERRRGSLRGFLKEAQADFGQWFTWSGQEPLVNLLVFDLDGTLLADSLVNNFPSEGKNYAERDYITGLLQDPERSAVYVSRVYVSYHDSKYKLAVITRIWDGERCLGFLAATLPVSSRLVVLDLKDEPAGAGLACPMDWTYPERHEIPVERWHEHIFVLHRDYAVPGQGPQWAPGAMSSRLRDLTQSGPALASVTLSRDGRFADYARVGDTHFVAVVEQPYPWPIAVVLRGPGFILSLVLSLVALGCLAARRSGRGKSMRSVLPGGSSC